MRPPRTASKICATLAVLVAAGTFIAAQIDHGRRHVPDIAPGRYWLPQLTQIWLPGLGAAFVLARVAFRLERRRPPP